MNKTNYLEDIWTFYKDKSGKYRWRRTATNGQIVGASTQGYEKSKSMKENDGIGCSVYAIKIL